MFSYGVAGQPIRVMARDADGVPVTGDAANITANLATESAVAATSDTHPTEVDATNLPGVYEFITTLAESQHQCLTLYPASATSGVAFGDPITIYPGGVAALQAIVARPGDPMKLEPQYNAAKNAAPAKDLTALVEYVAGGVTIRREP